MTKTYHVYFKEECIFKNLDKSEFNVIWGRIYKSYHKGDITYSVVTDQDYTDASF